MAFKNIVWGDRRFVIFDGTGYGLLFEENAILDWPERVPSAFGCIRSSLVYRDGELVGSLKSDLALFREVEVFNTFKSEF